MTKPEIRLNDEQRHLAVTHIGLVGFVLHRFGSFDLEFGDDAFQVGCMGLLKAARSYVPGRSQFSTYAVACILTELRNEARLAYAGRRGSGHAPSSLDVELACEHPIRAVDLLVDNQADVLGTVMYCEALRLIHSALRREHPVHARMIVDYLFRGYTQVEIARKHGCSQANVSQRIRNGRRRLRQALKGAGYE